MTVTGGDLVARTLTSFGVEVAFGLHGGHLDSLLLGCQRAGIRLIDTRHEAVAVNAADGYARATGRVGVPGDRAGPARLVACLVREANSIAYRNTTETFSGLYVDKLGHVAPPPPFVRPPS